MLNAGIKAFTRIRILIKVLGFTKKSDFSQGPYRWLSVASPEDPDGIELQLALNDNPAANAYQQAMFQQGQPAAMFFPMTSRGKQRIKTRGAKFTMAPTQVPGSTVARLNDGCGNLDSNHPTGTLVGRALALNDSRLSPPPLHPTESAQAGQARQPRASDCRVRVWS